MATKTATTVSAGERARRAEQRTQAKQGRASAATIAPDEAAAALEAEQVAQAQAQLAAVNLDEWIGEDFRVAFTEWKEWQEEGWDGQPVTRRRPIKRYALLNTLVSDEAQMRAWDLLMPVQERTRAGESIPPSELAEAQRRAVLVGWQEYEPEMTLERLAKGLTTVQTAAVLARFFTPTSQTGREPSAANPSSDGASPIDSDPVSPAGPEYPTRAVSLKAAARVLVPESVPAPMQANA